MEAQKDIRMEKAGRNSVNSYRQYAEMTQLQDTARLNKTKEIK